MSRTGEIQLSAVTVGHALPEQEWLPRLSACLGAPPTCRATSEPLPSGLMLRQGGREGARCSTWVDWHPGLPRIDTRVFPLAGRRRGAPPLPAPNGVVELPRGHSQGGGGGDDKSRGVGGM